VNWSGIDDFISLFWHNAQQSELLDRSCILKALFRAWQKVCGDENHSYPIVAKETSQAIHFHEFLTAFDQVIFINMIRDPRDNYAAIKAGANYYASMGESRFASLASVVNRARMDLLSAHFLSSHHPRNFKSVRFEDLTTEPETTMKTLADFCGLPFSANLLMPTELGRQFHGNNHQGEVFPGITPTHVGRWPERITSWEAQVIEFWCSDAMDLWEYPKHFSIDEGIKSFAAFYDWYNCKYFYHDSLK
jgi:hypothetical protein